MEGSSDDVSAHAIIFFALLSIQATGIRLCRKFMNDS